MQNQQNDNTNYKTLKKSIDAKSNLNQYYLTIISYHTVAQSEIFCKSVPVE